MFTIGQFARIGDVAVTTLRFYADEGLLAAAHVSPDTGYRYFTATQLPRLNRILALKDLGLSLDEIRRILDEGPSAAELRGMLRMRRAEIDQRLAADRARLDRVDARLRLIEKEGTMPTEEIILKHVDEQHGISMRNVVHGTSGIPSFLGDGFAAIGMKGLTPSGPPLVLYHDPEFDPEAIDMELFIPVPDGVHGPVGTPAGRQLDDRTLAAAEVAAVVHAGPYDTLGEVYQALEAWMDERGYSVAGPPAEIYLSGPDEPGPPVTEIRMPVARS